MKQYLDFMRHVRRNGAQWYTRHVMEGYGHLDNFVGRSAASEVFPWVLKELERGDAITPPRPANSPPARSS